MSEPEPPKRPSGDADTMPSELASAEHDRDRRSTMPDIAPPFEQRYRLGVELGRGGMGRVVEAFDTQLGRTVALKEVLPKAVGGGVERRFQREVQITARLEHASIVPLYDAGAMPDGRPFYVMRRVSGRPLDELIGRAKDQPERLALLPNLLAAIDAVAHAHRRGIIHRDLKPANILVGELGETVVIDWGLAKVIGEPSDPPASDAMELQVPSAADSLQTQVGSVFGTPGFMPPEQARGEELGPRGDVFALGATLYQLLVGRPPVTGKSATDAIASSITRRIQPVAIAAPGAPPELVAIVEKALAFEADDRYSNADKLGEDVRRFLTGQVVAAHRYTPRERIVRFARRHRAALSVAALAMVALAGLAWVGVHRIVVERDAANDARHDADLQRDSVQRANAELLERHDALLVTKARALLDSNPTNAVAILKEMRPGSPKVAEARAIAQAAVMRGVAWGLRSDGEPRYVTVDRDVTHLALVSADGTLHIWDLDTHRVVFERSYARDCRPVWIAGGRLLIMRVREPPDLFDPKTGVGERLALPPSWLASADDRGDHVAMIEDTGEAVIFDVASRTARSIWPGHKAKAIALGTTGAWVAVSDDKSTAVLDASGKEVAHHDGTLSLDGTFDDRFVVFDSGPTAAVVEVMLGSPTPTWREVPLVLPPKSFMIAAHYRGRELDVVTTAGVFAFRDNKASGQLPFVNYNPFMFPNAAEGVSINTGKDGNLRFSTGDAEGTIVLPVPMVNARVAGRAHHTRFIVASTGLVLVYDLAEILPIAIPKRGVFEAAFADDDTLLLWPGPSDDFLWRDLSTGATTQIVHPPTLPSDPISVDPRDGRVLVAEQFGATDFRLSLFTKGSPVVKTIAKVDGARGGLLGRLITNGVLVAEAHNPRIMVSLGGEPLHELAKVDGGVQSLQPLGDTSQFAALGHSGELVRGSVHGGGLDRLHVEIGPDAFLGTDRAGHVLIAAGNRLLIWDGPGVREVVKLSRPMTELDATAGGVIAVLDDNQAVYIEIGPRVTLHTVLVGSSGAPRIGADGGWVVSAGNGGQLTIVEMPSLARWTVPSHIDSLGSFLVASPTKRRVMLGTGLQLDVFDLPEPSTDLGAWIEDHTNAFETGDGLLTWPWQRP